MRPRSLKQLQHREESAQKVDSGEENTALLPGLELATFRSRVRRSTNKLSCFHPVLARWHIRPRSFYQKCSWQVKPKHVVQSPSGLIMLSRCGKLSGKWTHTQLVRKHSATVISARWGIEDWSWPKFKIAGAVFTLKIAQTGNISSRCSPKYSQATEKATTDVTHRTMDPTEKT